MDVVITKIKKLICFGTNTVSTEVALAYFIVHIAVSIVSLLTTRGINAFPFHGSLRFANEAEDKGVQTAEDSRFFGLSAGFDSFSNAGKELIIQYQAKYEKDIECGGGYVKVGPKLSDPKTFGDPTPYNIMFGPDKCGYTKRTHLIFSYKGKNVLKKSDLAYKQEGEGTSHVQLGSRLHAQ